MGVADKRDDISDTGQVADVVRNDLVQRVRVRCRVSDKALVVVDMTSAKLHFRIEAEQRRFPACPLLPQISPPVVDHRQTVVLRSNDREETP